MHAGSKALPWNASRKLNISPLFSCSRKIAAKATKTMCSMRPKATRYLLLYFCHPHIPFCQIVEYAQVYTNASFHVYETPVLSCRFLALCCLTRPRFITVGAARQFGTAIAKNPAVAFFMLTRAFERLSLCCQRSFHLGFRFKEAVDHLTGPLLLFDGRP